MPKAPVDPIANRLRAARKRLRISQTEVGLRTGLSVRTIAQIEKGRYVGADSIARVELWLDVAK